MTYDTLLFKLVSVFVSSLPERVTRLKQRMRQGFSGKVWFTDGSCTGQGHMFNSKESMYMTLYLVARTTVIKDEQSGILMGSVASSGRVGRAGPVTIYSVSPSSEPTYLL